MEELGRVAGAAGVFEQKRVVEVALESGGQLKDMGDAHAEKAGLHGVAHGLAVGQIERKGKRTEHLGGGYLGARSHGDVELRS